MVDTLGKFVRRLKWTSLSWFVLFDFLFNWPATSNLDNLRYKIQTFIYKTFKIHCTFINVIGQFINLMLDIAHKQTS